MSQPWKEILWRGFFHYPEITSDSVYIVSVDEFNDPRWFGQGDRYRGKTWYVVVFPIELGRTSELSVQSFRCGSTDPFPTVEEAIRRAEHLVPTGIAWQVA
jgi:hypothetical protein